MNTVPNVAETKTPAGTGVAKPRFYWSNWLLGSERECWDLFPDLFAALRGCLSPIGIKPVPTAWGTSAPLAQLCGRYPWIVEEAHTYTSGEKSRAFVAQFEDPTDAFFFAEAKEKAGRRIPLGTRWCVVLLWPDESGRWHELERFDPGWLRAKRRTHDAQERRQRHAA